MKDKKLEAILGMMDADSEEAVLGQMNNLAKILAIELNQNSPPKQEGCLWDLKYTDYGEKLRVAKLLGENEVCYMTIDMGTSQVFMSDPEDEDLRRMKLAMAYAVMMGKL